MTRDELLATLSEGVCPLCDSQLDKNRVCASGVEWDIKKGIEIRTRPYEGKDHSKNCGCTACYEKRSPIASQGLWQIIPANVDYADIETKLVGRDIKFTVNATENFRRLYHNEANLTDGPFSGIHVDYYKDES